MDVRRKLEPRKGSVVITPRVYQKEAIPLARKALREEKRALVVLATALGKTLTSAMIWHGFQKGLGLFLVHTNGILDHAMKEYQKVFGKRAKLVLFDGDIEVAKGADVVFATFQMMGNHLTHFEASYFGWMTVDETHHSMADSYRRVIEYFACPRLGITATPDRKDLRDIRELFGDPVINISLEEAIARKWLPDVEYHVVLDEGFDDDALQRIVKSVMEDGERLSVAEINRRVFIQARDEKIAEKIHSYEREKALIFCRNIDHVRNFSTYVKRSEQYHSDNTRDHNRGVLARLRNGTILRVLSVNAFNEGIDVPDVELVVFYRTTESDTIFRQQLGRGMRIGKKKLVVLDFVGNLTRIQMLKEMADRIKKLQEEYEGPAKKKKERGERDAVDPFHVSGRGFDFAFSDRVVDLLSVMDRVSTDFYPTWEEASVAAIGLGIKSQLEYTREYRRDPKLPSQPNRIYSDFPGYNLFLGMKYTTWQEAGAAAAKLGIKTISEYKGGAYKQDPKLPSSPHVYYPDFPRWPIFLGTGVNKYTTWKEAAFAAKNLGIQDSIAYKREYKRDPKLPGRPPTFYSDLPGWLVFFGKK